MSDPTPGRWLLDSAASTVTFEHKSLWGLVNVTLIRDPHGSPLYFVTQIQDITERKAAERQLKDRARQ